jgi:hypothetical protein
MAGTARGGLTVALQLMRAPGMQHADAERCEQQQWMEGIARLGRDQRPELCGSKLTAARA